VVENLSYISTEIIAGIDRRALRLRNMEDRLGDDGGAEIADRIPTIANKTNRGFCFSDNASHMTAPSAIISWSTDLLIKNTWKNVSYVVPLINTKTLTSKNEPTVKM
jgi:hypothetical protein